MTFLSLFCMLYFYCFVDLCLSVCLCLPVSASFSVLPVPLPLSLPISSIFSHHKKHFPCGYRLLCITFFRFGDQRKKDTLPFNFSYKNPEKEERPFYFSLHSQGQGTVPHCNLWVKLENRNSLKEAISFSGQTKPVDIQYRRWDWNIWRECSVSFFPWLLQYSCFLIYIKMSIIFRNIAN